MALRFMYDAAYPSASLPRVEVAAWYLGGDTPNPQRKPFTVTPYDLPIWVRSNPVGASEGASEGARVAGLLKAMSYAKGDTCALDYETAENDPYLAAFDSELVKAGYKTLLYGSQSTVLHNNKPSGGYWVAVWNDSPTLQAGWAAHQYANKGAFDLSVISDTVQLHSSKPVPTPVPVPVPTPHPLLDFMVTRPLLALGAKGAAVGEVQSLVNYWHAPTPPLVVDSDFGPKTKAAVQAFQSHIGVPMSGGVDLVTWRGLITGVR